MGGGGGLQRSGQEKDNLCNGNCGNLCPDYARIMMRLNGKTSVESDFGDESAYEPYLRRTPLHGGRTRSKALLCIHLKEG